MFRTLILISLASVMTGCISTPNTKALITPIGGIGYHTFKPERDPNRMPRVAQIAANQQQCAADANCAQHQ